MEFDDLVRLKKNMPAGELGVGCIHVFGHIFRLEGTRGLYVVARNLNDGAGAVDAVPTDELSLIGARWARNDRSATFTPNAPEVAQLSESSVEPPESALLPPDLRQAAATRWLDERDGSAHGSIARDHNGNFKYSKVTVPHPHLLKLIYDSDDPMSDRMPIAIDVILAATTGV